MLWAGSYLFLQFLESPTKVSHQFTVLYIIISSSQSWRFAGLMCLCRAHVLWMMRFVFLITASHPFPLCDIQINTLPLAFVLFALLFPASCDSLFLSAVLISPGTLSSSCPCFLIFFSFPSALSPHPQLYSLLITSLCCMPAGVSVLRSKYCQGSGLPSLTTQLTTVMKANIVFGESSDLTWWLKERASFVNVLKTHPECVRVGTDLHSRLAGAGGPPTDIVLIMQRSNSVLSQVCCRYVFMLLVSYDL